MSRQQLEAAYRGVLDRQMLEQLDEAWDIPCGSAYHDSEPSTHGGSAAWFMKTPCLSGFRCDKFRSAILARGRVGCDYGHVSHPLEDVTWTPIGAES